MRRTQYSEFIGKNRFIRKLTIVQFDHINLNLKEKVYKNGQVLWDIGDETCDFCFFAVSGKFKLTYNNDKKVYEEDSSDETAN